jgi:hypothetical protein
MSKLMDQVDDLPMSDEQELIDQETGELLETAPPDRDWPVGVPHVIVAANKVQGALSRIGIAKGQRNVVQKFNFRGIDDVYMALSGLLYANELVVAPRALSRTTYERKTSNGGALLFVVIEMEYALTSARDGSRLIASVYGEGMDSGDKATAKAQSAAYKQWAFQQFCIPVTGSPDADFDHHEVAPQELPKVHQRPSGAQDAGWPGPDVAAKDGVTANATVTRKSSAQLKSEGAWDMLTKSLALCKNADDLGGWNKQRYDVIQTLPAKWKAALREEFEKRREEIKQEQECLNEGGDPPKGSYAAVKGR